MKLLLGTVLTLVVAANSAFAGHAGGPEFGGFGAGFGGQRDSFHDFGHFGGFGGFDGIGGLGFGFGVYDSERQQSLFEQRFASLQTQYDNGVSDIADFYTSDTYDHIVDHTQSLVDRYGLFVSGVQRGADRLTDIINIANDDLTYYNDLLAGYQADDTLSAARIARIETWINHITDRINMRIDSLTEKQTTLQENLPTYQTFQTDLSTFLQTIVTAGGGTSDTTPSSLLAKPLISAHVNLLTASTPSTHEASLCSTAVPTTSGAVPEPPSITLFLTCLSVLAVRVRRRPNHFSLFA